jgi:hypothetical protein
MYKGISGNYKIQNLHKYVGKLIDPPYLPFKSLLESRIMKILDISDQYKNWGYEIITIPYKMIDGMHNYHVDFYVEYHNGLKELWEAKPANIVNKDYTTNVDLIEQYKKNEIKWKYAYDWCDKQGFVFKIITD